MRFRRMPSLRWHYPDQVYGYDLSRVLFGDRSTPWLEPTNIEGEGRARKRSGTGEGSLTKLSASLRAKRSNPPVSSAHLLKKDRDRHRDGLLRSARKDGQIARQLLHTVALNALG
jgi:hypothetical protein